MANMKWIGQFYDMLHLYSLTGEPSEKHCLLMNGDLVDRGSWSIEVILTAFAYKCEFLVTSMQYIYIDNSASNNPIRYHTEPHDHAAPANKLCTATLKIASPSASISV